VRTHSNWIIAWEALLKAELFIFGHHRQELSLYSKHIQCFFASLPVLFHSQVVNYNQAIHIRVAQQCDLELSNFTEFTDLQI
ncbi:hypothetical protein L208DRAFT_1228818, partial [Tricholoma matsutake]